MIFDNYSLREAIEMTKYMNLQEIYSLYGNISSWDTSNVTDMNFLFDDYNFKSKNIDISNWNTINVTSMIGTFQNAKFTKETDISGWKTNNVINMSYTFFRSNFNNDISNWNVSKVENMEGMFKETKCFTTFISKFIKNNKVKRSGSKNEYSVLNVKYKKIKQNNCNISRWQTGNVNNMSRMFEYSNFNSDISNWDTSNVRKFSYMFRGNSEFIGDISKWNTSNTIKMNSMFENSNFNGNINAWDVSNVKDMSSMFKRSRFNTSLSNWDTKNVNDMSYMFSFNDLSIGGLFTVKSNLNDIEEINVSPSDILYEAKYRGEIGKTYNTLFDIDYIPELKNYYNKINLFATKDSLEGKKIEDNFYEIDLEKNSDEIYTINFKNENQFKKLFEELYPYYENVKKGFELTIDTDYWSLSNWDVSNVRNMKCMFYKTSIQSLIDLDLSNWDVSKVNNMESMFFQFYCTSKLKIYNWDVSNVENMAQMFMNSNFNENISNWNVKNVKKFFFAGSGLSDNSTLLDKSEFKRLKAYQSKRSIYRTQISKMFTEKFESHEIKLGKNMFLYKNQNINTIKEFYKSNYFPNLKNKFNSEEDISSYLENQPIKIDEQILLENFGKPYSIYIYGQIFYNCKIEEKYCPNFGNNIKVFFNELDILNDNSIVDISYCLGLKDGYDIDVELGIENVLRNSFVKKDLDIRKINKFLESYRKEKIIKDFILNSQKITILKNNLDFRSKVMRFYWINLGRKRVISSILN